MIYIYRVVRSTADEPKYICAAAICCVYTSQSYVRPDVWPIEETLAAYAYIQLIKIPCMRANAYIIKHKSANRTNNYILNALKQWIIIDRMPMCADGCSYKGKRISTQQHTTRPCRVSPSPLHIQNMYVYAISINQTNATRVTCRISYIDQ